jgi:hypothetical protein
MRTSAKMTVSSSQGQIRSSGGACSGFTSDS